MNYTQLDAFESARQRDIGMKQAIDHADKVNEGWNILAYNFLADFVATSTHEFMAEDVRALAFGKVPEPPSKRAWGGIINKAAKAGLITRVGFRSVRNVKAHRAPCGVWKKA